MFPKPIFNVYVSQWWRQRPAWQSTFYSQSSFTISCSFWIVLLGFSFGCSPLQFRSLLKKRFHTAGCSVKPSNSTESLIYAHSLCLLFRLYVCGCVRIIGSRHLKVARWFFMPSQAKANEVKLRMSTIYIYAVAVAFAIKRLAYSLTRAINSFSWMRVFSSFFFLFFFFSLCQ